jgi:hypothetical protein
MTYAPELPFTIYAKTEKGAGYTPVVSAIFPSLIEDMLHFFESGAIPFPKEETLEAMKVREGVLAAAAEPGKTIALDTL